MKEKYTNIKSVKREEIAQTIEDKKSYDCIFPFTNRETEQFCSNVLQFFLNMAALEHLHTGLEYVTNELTANASKANSKRLYFELKGLDIENPAHYTKGMKSFKDDVFLNFKVMEEEHCKRGTYVLVRFSLAKDLLKLEIESSTPFLEGELVRIKERMAMAGKFNNLEEVLTHGFDSSEGAGFGLIIVLLTLRKANINPHALAFKNKGAGSLTSLEIPLNLITREQEQVIADVIAKELKQMPQFPSHIQNLQKELSDPECNFKSIARTIDSDSVLAAEILRVANSPVYKTGNRIKDVISSVRLMGMSGVKSLLYNYGMKVVMGERYREQDVMEICNHSYQVALIGSFIINHSSAQKIAEDVYIASLLHDMGKIIVYSLNRDLECRLEEICREKNIPLSFLESLTEGCNHALIGAEVALNWAFPKKLVQAIRYHHLPLEGDPEFKGLIYIVYLANEIFHYDQKKIAFEDFNKRVLSFFHLENPDSFEKLIQKMKDEKLLN